jgi:putative membrane protein
MPAAPVLHDKSFSYHPKSIYMKKLCFIAIAGAFFFCSCNSGTNETKSADSVNAVNNKDAEAMVQQPDTSMKTATPTVDEKSVDFATKAANSGMKEIELGKWAQEYATRQDVKDFGAMMVDDHTKAADELKRIAKTKNITLPVMVPDNVRNSIDKMKTKKAGSDLDKAYVNEMVDDHKDAIKLFEDASKNATDADLKNFAAKTLPVLQHHYDAIKAIKAKM